MIRKILIACGGEAAVRLIRESRDADVLTVAVYTEQDFKSEHVRLAEEAICIGKTLKSYHHHWQRIISAAQIAECDAIHISDGPLSTNSEFVEDCRKCDIRVLGSDIEPDFLS